MNYNVFREQFTAEKLIFGAPMSEYTSFKVGGPADLMVLPANPEEAKKAVLLCKANSFPYFIMGNGSNLVVKDSGVRGVIISLSKNFEKVELLDGLTLRADAGITLAKLAGFAAEHELSGLEFASGIPGTLGGAVYMNAGAYGGEMKDLIETVRIINEDGNEFAMDNSELAFDYRSSIFQKSSYIITSCRLKLRKGSREQIKAAMLELNARRKEKQPLELPSGGSTFKRPGGYYAAKLIEDAGLKGFTIGGAKVSEKHAGFIVNYNNAAAGDIIALMEHVKSEVYSAFGILLVPEVEIIG